MSVRKFKFVSPGVFVKEIDNSQLPALPREVGPVVFGRAEKGPAMRPIQIDSLSSFVETFGNPIFGCGNNDQWRAGPSNAAPSYGTYAAVAYLKNRSPLVFVRLAGIEANGATSGGKAGWQATGAPIFTSPTARNGGAFGLFMLPSASNLAELGTGSLAAIFYATTGSICLSGTLVHNSGTTAANQATGTCGLFQSQFDNSGFTIIVKDGEGDVQETVPFDFSLNSQIFIRESFNTNPVLANTSNQVTKAANRKTYWLGESFYRSVKDNVGLNNAGETFGIILGLESGTVSQGTKRMPLTQGESGWFIGQDLGSFATFNAQNAQKLFKFVGLESGQWNQGNLKVSITDIAPSTNSAVPYGTFSVQIRMINDNDAVLSPVEQYSNVNLDPFSPNYIARKIGDSYRTWDETSTRYQTYGTYPNQSRYVRVKVDDGVRDGTINAAYVPFGVFGPTRYTGFTLASGSDVARTLGASTAFSGVFAQGDNDVPDSLANANEFFVPGLLSGSDATDLTTLPVLSASFEYPAVPLRQTSATPSPGSTQADAYFGANTNSDGNSYEHSIPDILRRKPDNLDNNADSDSVGTVACLEYSWVFTLDDISGSSTATTTVLPLGTYVSGSRQLGTSYTAVGGTPTSVIDIGLDSFTTVFNAGFDGLNIVEAAPFRNTLLAADTEPTTNYAYASVGRAIDTVSDADVVECNLMTLPGLTENTLTKKLMDTCEARGDALGIIDLDGGYIPPTENASASDSTRNGSLAEVIQNLKQRQLNNSYGCCYYPWVMITDDFNNGGTLVVPPSVAALGTFASSEAQSELWFAPAGFNRGGLTVGSAGIPVSNVTQRLNQRQRDQMYDININPIATFPAEGIVIYGQKTLQITDSALDRINVRRLMIYVKREISRIAALLLFDQNVQNTWNRFLGQVNPFLQSVKTRLGLTDYKVILDHTTTTPDLVDRNIMYAKIFLKPARAIEFIALDFVITRTGAGFED